MKQSAINRIIVVALSAVIAIAVMAAQATAQQITGTPGSPSATTTISGKQLPPPDPKFGGVIKEKASESKAWWAPRVVPPKGAPNVLLIMTDDSGFGAPGTFGGVIPTPALDRIAKNGLRYTNFHSTSLCSPTRAAMITGRNHHSAGFGVVGEIATGFPGYDSIIPIEKGTIGTILKDERVRNLVVRQGPQHALLPVEPGRAVRTMAERHGLRVLLRLRRRRRQPVAAEPVPQHDGHLPLRGQSRLEPDHGHGRRGDPVHEAAQGDRARQTVLCLLRAGRHPRAASSDAGVDQEDQRHASVRRRLEQAARDHLRQPEATGHHARERQADAVAEGTAGVGFPRVGSRRSSSSSRRTSTGLTSPTPTTRSAGSSRPSKTSASSTTP